MVTLLYICPSTLDDIAAHDTERYILYLCSRHIRVPAAAERLHNHLDIHLTR